MNIFSQEVFSMQIAGLREFFSRITLQIGTPTARGDALLSILPSPLQQKQPGHDSLSLSDLGKKLSLTLSEKESPSLIERPTTDPADSLPSWARPLDKALSQTIDILERMQKLAVAAQDKNLSDLERIKMQIEIGDLRCNLYLVPRNLRMAQSGAPEIGRMSPLDHYGPEGPDPFGDYGDYSSMLERARDRILNGQEWNVREAWCPDGFSRMTQDENGEEVLEVFAGKTWYVVDDRNVLTKLLHETEYRDSGIKVPTVRERLERCSVVVMDAQSAAKGASLLEEQIASARKFREQLPDMIKQSRNPLEATCAFLDRLSDGASFICSDHANYFLFKDGIYSLRYGNPKIVKKDEGNPSLAEKGSLENKTFSAEGTSEVSNVAKTYFVPKLLEENIVFTPNPVRVVYVEGFSKWPLNNPSPEKMGGRPIQSPPKTWRSV